MAREERLSHKDRENKQIKIMENRALLNQWVAKDLENRREKGRHNPFKTTRRKQ